MLTLGIIFTIIGSIGFLIFNILIFSMISYFSSFIETLKFMFYDPTSFFIFLTSIIFLVLGIIFIIIGKKKKKAKIALINKANEEKEMMRNQINALQQKELELKILKENNLIKDNNEKFCSYCGAKLKNDELQCSHCGSTIEKFRSEKSDRY